MESIYEEVCKMEKSRIGELQDSIRKAYETAEHSFVCVDDEEREQLQKFAFICNLSFDVYVKKQLIEKWWTNFQSRIRKNKSVSFLRRIKKERISDFEIRSFLLLCVWQ